MPDFTRETACGAAQVCGVDEAGRGPLAGPVVAAAVMFPDFTLSDARIHDSKKLSAKLRAELAAHIRSVAHVGIGISSAEEIDAINILQASLLAMKRAVEALPSAPEHALIDGNQRPALTIPCTTLVKGDAISMSVAAASIIAKVTRDDIMASLAARYPVYGFEKHSGYGTAAHLSALHTYGPCPEHRRSFAPVKTVLNRAA